VDQRLGSATVYSFGPYRLDEHARRLHRGTEPVALSDRQLDLLLLLVAQAGQVVPKAALLDTAWPDVAVGDNSLEQAISGLRRALGRPPTGTTYVETLARRGYRLGVPVTRSVARHTDQALESLLAPYRAFVEGRAALETLTSGAVARARGVFEEMVHFAPDFAPGHVGLANALAFGFEAARADDTPDAAALLTAVHHAREACRLDANYGEAWATLAFVLSPGGSADAAAAGRRAVTLEPDNWRHQARLAYVTWGEERLRAARRALALLPGFGLAHWLAATVHVARQAFDEAERELVVGTAAQDQGASDGRFGSVGLHLLLGLLLFTRGDEAGAVRELRRELEFEQTGHIYAREACANSWSALGAMHLGGGDTVQAVADFQQALERVPNHSLALAAVATLSGGDAGRAASTRLEQRLALFEAYGLSFDAAMTRGASQALAGRHDEAAALVHAALQAAPVGTGAGWRLPVDPFFQTTRHAADWQAALATLRHRAA
jgi:DNA-binding winged helix-turn-helix (wHTH) protein/Flp pilus assembly protein TadD